MDCKLIAMITSLPMAGMDHAPYLLKYQETMMIAKVKYKYDLVRANRGLLISSINDYTIRFVAKVLSCKMLHKMRPTQCTAGTVALAELCAKGVQINWCEVLTKRTTTRCH